MAKVTLLENSYRNYQWRVCWRAGSKAKQKWFVKKAEAKAFADTKAIEMENHGTAHGDISNEDRAALIQFREAISKLPEPRPALSDCVNLYLATIANQLKPITVHELIAKRVASAVSKGVHTRTMRDLIGTDGKGGRLGSFAAKFGDRKAGEIASGEIEQWLTERCPTDANRREMMVRLNGLFRYGIKKKFLAVNPLAESDMPNANAARAAVLSVKQSAKLLASCPPRSLPALAVQIFAGLRKAETERLTWERIDFEDGTISVIQRKGAKKGKKLRAKMRHVPLLPALRAWLEPHRQLAGPVFPTGRTEGTISEQAYRNDFTEARRDAGITEWDENTLRHTYGSMRTADINDLPKVALEMGHADTATTSEHYVNAVKPKDAAAFWNLRPQTERPANVTTMQKTA